MARSSHFLLPQLASSKLRLSTHQGGFLQPTKEAKVGRLLTPALHVPSGSHHHFQGALCVLPFSPNEKTTWFTFSTILMCLIPETPTNPRHSWEKVHFLAKFSPPKSLCSHTKGTSKGVGPGGTSRYFQVGKAPLPDTVFFPDAANRSKYQSCRL